MALATPPCHSPPNSRHTQFLSLNSMFSCVLILDSTTWLALASGTVANMVPLMLWTTGLAALCACRGHGKRLPQELLPLSLNPRMKTHGDHMLHLVRGWNQLDPEPEAKSPGRSFHWPSASPPAVPKSPSHQPEDQQLIIMVFLNQEATKLGPEHSPSSWLLMDFYV